MKKAGSEGRKKTGRERYVLRAAEAAAAAARTLAVPGLLSYAFYDSAVPFLIVAAPALFFFLKKERVRHTVRRKELLKRQFLSAGNLLCDYLRSGYAVENAMQKSLTELRALWGDNSEIVREWENIVSGIRIGEPVETGLQRFAARSGIGEIRDFAEVFAAVKRTGGQIGEVLTSATELLSEKFRTEEQIRTMIAGKQFEQRVMDVMPIGILLYIRLSAPEMVSVLYTTLVGRLVMTGCLAVYILAFFWAEKIVKIEA